MKQFLSEVWAELKKTTWPSRKEVYGTTLVVIVTVLICAFYLWVVDLFLSKGMNVIFEALK
jgi:preprotein translocase subunit SecE